MYSRKAEKSKPYYYHGKDSFFFVTRVATIFIQHMYLVPIFSFLKGKSPEKLEPKPAIRSPARSPGGRSKKGDEDDDDEEPEGWLCLFPLRLIGNDAYSFGFHSK